MLEINDLTDRQRKILAHIVAETIAKGRPPALREIAEEFSINSTNGVACHVTALEKKGYLTVAHGSHRGLIVNGLALRVDFEDTPAGKRLQAALR